MKAEKTPFWVLLGPALLLAVIALLLIKSAPLFASPFWLLGLCVSTLLAGWISYLAFQEIERRQKDLKSIELERVKAIEDLRSVLDETHLIYRDKIAKLEETICLCEKEQGAKLTEKQNTLSQLQKGHEELLEQLHYYKNQANSFQAALEEALNELRDLSQIHYLECESGKKIPKDLLKQHEQLRAQFEEKSHVLDQTRKRLFETEGYLLELKKERGLELLGRNDEQEVLIRHIDELIQENLELEKEIVALEKLIASSLKPSSSKKTGKKLQEMLEFQFENTST